MPRPPDRLRLPFRREVAVRGRVAWLVARSPHALRVASVTLLLASVLMSAYLAGPGACVNRSRGRADVRALGVGMVDEVADYAHLTADQRAEVTARAQARALEEVPPPDCWAWPAP